MLSSVIRRFFSSNTDPRIIAAYIKTGSKPSYLGLFDTSKIDADHPQFIIQQPDGKFTIVMQATSSPYVIRQSADETVSKQETILLDENNNIVGDAKPQYGLHPTEDIPVNLKDLKIIAGSDKFIARNRETILSKTRDKNNVVSEDE